MLQIRCDDWPNLNTTNINLTKRVLYEHVFDFISIIFSSNDIKYISDPFIENSDMADKIEVLSFSAISLVQIDDNAFERLPKLRHLEIRGCSISGHMISSGLD